MSRHDLVIRGGTVIDGRGEPARSADVAVDGHLISEVGEVEGRRRRELDANGALVTPGWVDIHTHYDAQAMWDPELAPSSWHGVTTAVMGNCGVGFAPVRAGEQDYLIGLMQGVEDIPAATLRDGMSWEWETFGEYLHALDRVPRAIDVAAQVPHAALRVYAMGDRGADHEELPTAEEILQMGELAASAIEAGALGFTTSRTVSHRTSDGRFTPCLTAGADELLGVARSVGRTGRGVFEAVADLVELGTEFDLLRSMVEVSGRPLSLTVLQRRNVAPDEYTRILESIARAAADGVAIRGQVAARPVGIILSLDSRSHPLLPSPTYGSLADLPLEQRVLALRQLPTRTQILNELSKLPLGMNPLDGRCAFPLGDPPCYHPPAEHSIAARASAEGRSLLEVAYDLLLEDGGRGMIYVPSTNYVEGDLRAVRDMLVHPYTLPGLGDAGAHSTFMCDASFPTFLLSYWGRDAPEDTRLAVEWIVRRQCAETADFVGLHDRGVVAPGYLADLNVIDLDQLTLHRPVMRTDLPAGAARLVQPASGYRATVVHGEVTALDGERTGALPGRLVRGPRDG